MRNMYRFTAQRHSFYVDVTYTKSKLLATSLIGMAVSGTTLKAQRLINRRFGTLIITPKQAGDTVSTLSYFEFA